MTKFTFQDFVSSELFGAGNTLTADQILISLFLTFVISLLIYYIYRKTHSSALYSAEFNLNLVLIPLIIATIMMGISTNLAISLGMVGALSIVRFRNAIKDPRDLTFLFWAIAVGIVNGVQLYALSVISTLFIAIVMLVFSGRFDLTRPHILVMRYSGTDERKLLTSIKTGCTQYKLKNTVISEEGSEKIFEVVIKPGHEDHLLKELKSLDGAKSINLFSSSGELGE
ncbi:MAG: DUF4956 domain-containing protein [Pseudomonadota bacterium]